MSDETTNAVVFLEKKYQLAKQDFENALLAAAKAKVSIADCFAAARVLGIELSAGEAKPSVGRPAAVKAFIMNAVKASHPSPISTSEIKNRLRFHGWLVHEKTAGVCLNRLTKSGHIARTNHAVGRGHQSLWVLPPVRKVLEAALEPLGETP
jgi:hypothetical protein